MNFLNSLIGKMNFLDSPISEKEYLQKVLTICFPKDHSQAFPKKIAITANNQSFFQFWLQFAGIWFTKWTCEIHRTKQQNCIVLQRRDMYFKFSPPDSFQLHPPSLPDNVVFAGNQSYLNFAKVWMGKWKKTLPWVKILKDVFDTNLYRTDRRAVSYCKIKIFLFFFNAFNTNS